MRASIAREITAARRRAAEREMVAKANHDHELRQRCEKLLVYRGVNQEKDPGFKEAWERNVGRWL